MPKSTSKICNRPSQNGGYPQLVKETSFSPYSLMYYTNKRGEKNSHNLDTLLNQDLSNDKL